jgi:serine/alanine racemase
MEVSKARNVLIDLSRIVCSILVICVHTKPWLDTNYYFGYFLSDVIARLAVPLFFMLAGYFLYKRLREECNPDAYFKKYLMGLIRIYIVWCLIYLPFDFYMLLKIGKTWIGAILSYAYSILVAGGHYHLWYFPALIYSVLIAYILFRKGGTRMLYPLTIALYIIGLISESYSGWFTGVPAHADITFIVYVLGTSRSALFFGLPFVVMGMFQHEKIMKLKNKTLALAAFISLYLLTLEALYLHWRWNIEGDNLFIFLPLAVVMIFTLLIKNPVSLPRLNSMNSRYLRDMSLLIYCLHMWPLIFIDKFLAGSISNIYRFIICLVSTIVLSGFILRFEKIRKMLV